MDIPYRLIRSVEIRPLIRERRRAPATVFLQSGKSLAIELDPGEEERLMVGQTDYGEFRIRLGKIRRIDIVPAAPAQAAP